MSRWEIRLSGSGGQGMILAGIILASAATKEGKNAIQNQSYGPEARGGASRAEVIISNDEIDYPEVTAPNFLLALTEESFKKYTQDIPSDCIVLTDNRIRADVDSVNAKVYSIPILDTAEKELNRRIVANMVALGATICFTEAVSVDTMKEAIKSFVPKGTEEVNIQAFDKGYEIAKGRK